MRRTLIVASLVVLVLAGSPQHAVHPAAQAEDSPMLRGEHPRLFINSTTWNEISTVLGTGGGFNSQFQAWVTWLDGTYGTPVTKASEEWALNFAFAGLMAGSHPSYPAVQGVVFGHTGPEYTARALELFRQFKARFPNAPPQGSPEALPPAMVYDWTFHRMPLEERPEFAAWLSNNSLSDSGVDAWADAGDVINRAARLLRGIAIHGDGYNDAWAAAAVARWATWFRSSTQGSTHINSLYGGSDSGFAQGYLYAMAYTIWPLQLAEEGYRTALAISKESHYGSSETNALRFLPKWFVDMFVGAFPRVYDPVKYPTDGYQWWFYNSELVYYTPDSALRHATPVQTAWRIGQSAAGTFAEVDPAMSGLAKWLVRHRIGDNEVLNYQQGWIWGRPLMGRGSLLVAERSPASLSLPLSKRRGDGMWVFRTGWESNIDQPTVLLLAAPWLPQDYGFRHTGAFHVYRKGPQIHRGASTDGHHNKTGIAGSIMAFVNRGTPHVPANGQYFAGDYWRVGAERTGGIAPDYEAIKGTAHEGARVLREWLADGTAGRDVDYVSLDLTRLYSSTLYSDQAGPRISEYVRQFVYFRPADPLRDSVRLVIFDRPTVVEPFNWQTLTGKHSKSWLLWTAGEPQFSNGTVNPGPARGPTGTHGKLYSDDSTLVTATNTAHGADGTTWLTPIRPTNRRIIKVGGPSAEGRNWYYDGTDPSRWSHEYETPTGYVWKAGTYGIDGVRGSSYPEFSPPYHIEVEDMGSSPTSVFLNVVEVGDSTSTRSETAGVGGVNFVGAMVGDRIAVFGESVDSVGVGSFVIPRSGDYKILVVNLIPSAEYIVSVAGVPLTMFTSEAGTLYLERTVSADAVVQLQATGVAAPGSPANVRVVK